MYRAAIVPPMFRISIHALRVEGDSVGISCVFPAPIISIHALRVEGDRNQHFADTVYQRDFYPRPPGGGRLPIDWYGGADLSFLSTPSGWRATKRGGVAGNAARFLSTPSGWRATAYEELVRQRFLAISIHALRVEGDLLFSHFVRFRHSDFISIHALRVEGDK